MIATQLRVALAVQDRTDPSMQNTRFVRNSATFVALTLAGFALGCSGDQHSSPPPPNEEESKKIAAEMKNAMKQGQAARAAAKKGGGPR